LLTNMKLQRLFYAFDVEEIKLNSIESIGYKVFETISVESPCIFNTLKLITNKENLILNITIESTYDIANITFI
jgi:hypothetical protein